MLHLQKMASVSETSIPILQIDKAPMHCNGKYVIDRLNIKLGDATLISHVEEICFSNKLGKYKRFIIHFKNSNNILNDIFEIIHEQHFCPIIYTRLFSFKDCSSSDLHWDLTLYKPLIFTNTIT